MTAKNTSLCQQTDISEDTILKELYIIIYGIYSVNAFVGTESKFFMSEFIMKVEK